VECHVVVVVCVCFFAVVLARAYPAAGLVWDNPRSKLIMTHHFSEYEGAVCACVDFSFLLLFSSTTPGGLKSTGVWE